MTTEIQHNYRMQLHFKDWPFACANTLKQCYTHVLINATNTRTISTTSSADSITCTTHSVIVSWIKCSNINNTIIYPDTPSVHITKNSQKLQKNLHSPRHHAFITDSIVHEYDSNVPVKLAHIQHYLNTERTALIHGRALAATDTAPMANTKVAAFSNVFVFYFLFTFTVHLNKNSTYTIKYSVAASQTEKFWLFQASTHTKWTKPLPVNYAHEL